MCLPRRGRVRIMGVVMGGMTRRMTTPLESRGDRRPQARLMVSPAPVPILPGQGVHADNPVKGLLTVGTRFERPSATTIERTGHGLDSYTHAGALPRGIPEYSPVGRGSGRGLVPAGRDHWMETASKDGTSSATPTGPWLTVRFRQTRAAAFSSRRLRIVTFKSRWDSGSRTMRTAVSSSAVPIRRPSTR